MLTTSYFLTHLRVINLLVQTLKKYKSKHTKEKIDIHSNLGWRYGILLIGDGAPVSNGCLYYILLRAALYCGRKVHQGKIVAKRSNMI